MKRRKQGSEEPTSSSKSLNENEKSHQLNSKSGLVIFPLFTAIWPKLIRNNSFYKYPHDGTIVYSSFASAVIYLANVVLAKSKISMEDIYNNIYGSWIQRKDGFFLQINPANYDFLWKSFENELKKQQWNIIIKTKYVYVLNQSIKSMNNHYIFFSDQNMTLPHKIYQIIKNNLDYGNKITFTELFEKLICQNYQCPNGQRYCITESDRNRIYRYILWLPFIEKEGISYSVNQCNTDKIKDYRITKIYEPVPCKSLPADLLTKIITIINQCDPFQCGMTLSEIISEISLYENQCSSSEVEEVLNSNPLFFNYHGYYGIRPAIEFTSEECEIQVTEKDVSFIELLYYTVLQNQPISYQVICKKMNNQYFYVNKNKCLITIDYMNKIKKQLKKMPFFLQTPEDDYFVFPKACECDFYGRLYANVIDNYNGRSFDSLRVQYSPIEAIFSCCLAKRDKKSVENSSIETKKLTSNESIIHSSLNIPIPENFHEYQDLFIGKTFVEMKNLVKIPIFEGNPPLSPSEQLFAFAIFARCGKKSEKYFSPETIASYLSGETITVGQRTVVFDNENDYSVCQIVEIVLKRSQYFVIKEKENPLDSDQYSIYMKINETSSSINYAYPSFKDLLIKVLDSLHRSENRFNPNFTLAEISDKMESQKYLISKNKVETFHNENQVANLMIQTYLGMPDFIIKNDHYGLKNWCQSVNHKPPAKPRSRITPIIQLLKKDEILRSYDETTNTFGGRSTNFGKTIKYSKIFNEKRNQVNINLMDETHFHCKVIDDRQSFSKVNNVKNVKENLKNHDNFTLNKACQSNISSFFVKESINFQTGLTNDFCKENVEKKYVDQNTENDDTTKSPDEVLEEENILVKTMKNLSNKPYYSNQQTENKSHNRYAKFIGILADPTKRQIECDKLFSKNGITKEKLRNYQKKSFLKKRGRPRLHSCDSDDSDEILQKRIAKNQIELKKETERKRLKRKKIETNLTKYFTHEKEKKDEGPQIGTITWFGDQRKNHISNRKNPQSSSRDDVAANELFSDSNYQTKMNNHNANELQQFTPKYTFDILFQNSSDSCFDEEELASIFENSELDSSEQTSKSTKENTIDVEVNLSKDIMNEEEEHSEYLKGSYQSKWFIQKTTKRNSYVSPINSSIGKPIGKMTVMMEMIECFPNNNSYQSLKETLQQLLQYHDFSIDEAISFLSNSFLKNNESYDHFVQRVINTIGQIKGSLS